MNTNDANLLKGIALVRSDRESTYRVENIFKTRRFGMEFYFEFEFELSYYVRTQLNLI